MIPFSHFTIQRVHSLLTELLWGAYRRTDSSSLLSSCGCGYYLYLLSLTYDNSIRWDLAHPMSGFEEAGVRPPLLKSEVE